MTVLNWVLVFFPCYMGIYIIISKNIRYLLWNRGLWRSLNNTYPIFLTPCIRYTNHLCDSCDLTDVNPHFIPSLLLKIQNDIDTRAGRQQLWRHNDGLFPRVCYGRFLSTIWCWGRWFNEFVRHFLLWFLCLSYFLFYFVTPVFQHGASLVPPEHMA